MRHTKMVAACLLLVATHVHAADEWAQGAYGLNYLTPYSVPELRESSVYGWRADAKVQAYQWLFLSGSYDYQKYDAADAASAHQYRYRTLKYGPLLDVPMGDAWTISLRASRQERRFEGYEEDSFSGGSSGSYGIRGFGYLGGLRWTSTNGMQIATAYEIAPLKFRYEPYDVEEKFKTASVSLTLPLTRALALALEFEKAKYTDSIASEDFSQDSSNENLLIGLRYAL